MRKRCITTALAFCMAALILLLPENLRAAVPPDWTQAIPPYRIMGNLYYVGSKDLASYLITTQRGHILINSNLVSSVPQIKASVEKLGFHFSDVKILLISHGHWDHCAGTALLKKLTGAQYMVMDSDVPTVESGGKSDFHYGNDKTSYYPETKVDRVLHDGDKVQLGDVVLIAYKTAGHTKGCTTWTMSVQNHGKSYNVVIVGSPNVNQGYDLLRNRQYPQIAADFEQSFRTWRALPCDIFLGAHGGYYGMLPKIARLNAGDTNAFVDPEGYQSYIAEREHAFRTELTKQRKAHP